jgi:hypothetical protein
MGQKMVCFGALRGTRSRQDESIEVHEVGSKRPSLGCNGVHVLSLYPLTWRSFVARPGTRHFRAEHVSIAGKARSGASRGVRLGSKALQDPSRPPRASRPPNLKTFWPICRAWVPAAFSGS